MKQLLLAVLGFAASVAQAGHENAGIGTPRGGDEAIYESLMVEAIYLNPGIAGVGRFGKYVGGLACERSQVIVPDAPIYYSCTFESYAEGDEAIYESLNIAEEVLNAGIAGSSRTRKAVGDLTCYRSMLIFPGSVPSYSCAYTVEQTVEQTVRQPRH